MSTVLRCDECGYTTKPGSKPGTAAYGMRSHSCDRQRARSAAHARGQARKAMVDRTPKPCQHKRAHHEHGTYAAYVLDHCRCHPCTAANGGYERHRIRQQAYGRWIPLVDAQPARDHVKALTAAGMGLKRIANASGVAQSSLGKLIYGDPARGTQPSKRIRPDTEAAILAVTVSLDTLGTRTPVDPTGTRRRLQALVAIGWSQSKLAAHLGWTPANFGHMLHGNQGVGAETALKVRALYDQLWDNPPPRESHRDLIACNRSVRYAQARDWAPPLAWDDETIDQPAAQPAHRLRLVEAPTLDEAARYRRIHGDRTVRLTRDERHEAVRRMHAAGNNDQQIADALGFPDRTILRDRQALNLPAVRALSMEQRIAQLLRAGKPAQLVAQQLGEPISAVMRVLTGIRKEQAS